MSNETPDLNPYASPAIPDGLVQQPVVSSYERLKDVKRFRSEIHALGGVWIAIGLFPIGMALLVILETAVQSELTFESLLATGTFLVIGTPFVVIGIFTCRKQMWAVYVGLVMCYLVAGLSLPFCNLFVALVSLAGVFGGHRIISWAQELRRKGIPLTTRPRDIKTPIQLPPLP
jgi:hypothetical protein